MASASRAIVRFDCTPALIEIDGALYCCPSGNHRVPPN
jgi:hypothetical protein